METAYFYSQVYEPSGILYEEFLFISKKISADLNVELSPNRWRVIRYEPRLLLWDTFLDDPESHKYEYFDIWVHSKEFFDKGTRVNTQKGIYKCLIGFEITHAHQFLFHDFLQIFINEKRDMLLEITDTRKGRGMLTTQQLAHLKEIDYSDDWLYTEKGDVMETPFDLPYN